MENLKLKYLAESGFVVKTWTSFSVSTGSNFKVKWTIYPEIDLMWLQQGNFIKIIISINQILQPMHKRPPYLTCGFVM